MSPPMTITPGLKKFTALARTPPSSRPAWRTRRMASGRPSRTWRTAARRVFGGVADDVAAVVGGDAQVGEAGGHGAAAGDRFQAAEVAAAADDVVVVGDVDVTDVAGGAPGAAVEAPVGDH